VNLLYALDDGIKAQAARNKRFEDGNPLDEDFNTRAI
jgi:hypothetical protein